MTFFLKLIDKLELAPCKCLPKLPTRRRHVVAGEGSPVTGGDLKRQALAVDVRVALPILAPIPRHRLPPAVRSLNRHRVHIPCSADVRHQHQVEVRVPVDGKPYPALLHAGHPPEGDRDDSGSVLGDLQESRLG